LSNHDGCRARFDAASSQQTGFGFDRTPEIHDSHVVLVQRSDPAPDANSADCALRTLSFYKVSETMR
jgi:hypothetical protein